MIRRLLATLGIAALALSVWAAEALTGEVQKQPLNVSAIIMFVLFVGATLCITYWASKRNKSAADYYAAGGKITGFQNGLAIAGDLGQLVDDDGVDVGAGNQGLGNDLDAVVVNNKHVRRRVAQQHPPPVGGAVERHEV